MTKIQSSLIKKIKFGRPEHLLTPTPVHPITSHFCLIGGDPPQSGRHMCITPNTFSKLSDITEGMRWVHMHRPFENQVLFSNKVFLYRAYKN